VPELHGSSADDRFVFGLNAENGAGMGLSPEKTRQQNCKDQNARDILFHVLILLKVDKRIKISSWVSVVREET
jgi:hypothetical protein